MSIRNLEDKYIEITAPERRNLHHVKFFRRVVNQIRKDPARKAYYRNSIRFPNKKTVYATVPINYESQRDLRLFDKHLIGEV